MDGAEVSRYPDEFSGSEQVEDLTMISKRLYSHSWLTLQYHRNSVTSRV